MSWQRPNKPAAPIKKAEQAPAPANVEAIADPLPAPRKQKVEVRVLPQEFRDELVSFLALLEEKLAWKRMKKGYRPGNDALHDHAEKLRELMKKY